MQNLHTGPFDIYAPLPFTFCIRANDVGNGVVPFPAFALTALGLVLESVFPLAEYRQSRSRR